jgi:hypothetical protein
MEAEMMETFAAAVLAMVVAAGAQAQAGGGQVYKNDKGTCQVTLPADWKIGDFNASDPKRTLSVMVNHPQDAKVEKADEMFLKGVYGAEKVFENSAQRIFVESKTQAFGPEPAGRKWEVLVPAIPKGACQAIIIFTAGASEDVARAIAMSLKPVK